MSPGEVPPMGYQGWYEIRTRWSIRIFFWHPAIEHFTSTNNHLRIIIVDHTQKQRLTRESRPFPLPNQEMLILDQREEPGITWSFHHLTMPRLDSYRGVTLMTTPCRHEELNHHCLRSTTIPCGLRPYASIIVDEGGRFRKVASSRAKNHQFQTSYHLCCKSDHSVGRGNLQTIQIDFKNSRHSDTPPLVLHLDIS